MNSLNEIISVDKSKKPTKRLAFDDDFEDSDFDNYVQEPIDNNSVLNDNLEPEKDEYYGIDDIDFHQIEGFPE